MAEEVWPRLVFGTPRKLPAAESLQGRVVVLDIAFAADGMGTPFEEVTGRFLAELGDRLAVWVDHHDHEFHARYADDPRFVLATKARHGACPEMITPDMVADVGPVDTIMTHSDLDGLYAAAKWIRKGVEPYPGADVDARKVDTRTGGDPSPPGELVDHALRARFRDEALKHRIVRWLVGGARKDDSRQVVAEAAEELRPKVERSRQLARSFEITGQVAVCDAHGHQGKYDKTELLLLGQRMAPVSLVMDSGMVTIAAGFDSGWNFVSLLELGGGMPTRVSLPGARMDEAIRRINAHETP